MVWAVCAHTHTLSFKKKKQLGSLGSVMGKLSDLPIALVLFGTLHSSVMFVCVLLTFFSVILSSSFVSMWGVEIKKNVFGFSPATPQTAASKGSIILVSTRTTKTQHCNRAIGGLFISLHDLYYHINC